MIAFLCLIAALAHSSCVNCVGTLPDVRPDIDKRTFQSTAIDALIKTLQPLIAEPNLATLLSNCLPNTLDTTVASYTSPEDADNADDIDTFIITGDIDALWLRDSANQVLPYLPYAAEDSNLRGMIEGLINRHGKSVLIDSFANAFNFNASGQGHQDDIRKPPMTPSVFEGKYEIDSLGAFLKLSYWHWQLSGDDALLRFSSTDSWLPAVQQTIDTIRTMQDDDGSTLDTPYLFQRLTTAASDTLILQGRGPAAQLTGMSRSLFRPSDDAVTLPYNIPGNAMACVELTHTEEMLKTLHELHSGQSSAASGEASRDVVSQLLRIDRALQSAESVRRGICSSLDRAIIAAKQQKKQSSADLDVSTTTAPTTTTGALPYEVDGFSAEYFMDDANIPSLLSLPVLGYLPTSNDVYQATREFVLSSQNPFFFSGLEGSGIGGPHEGFNYTWPMAIIMQAMTSTSDEEVSWCLDLLVKSSAGTGLMHESFNVNNVNDFTRSWFAWVNGMLGELLLQLVVTKPHLLLLDDEQAIATAQAAVKAPVSLLAQQSTIIPASL